MPLVTGNRKFITRMDKDIKTTFIRIYGKEIEGTASVTTPELLERLVAEEAGD